MDTDEARSSRHLGRVPGHACNRAVGPPARTGSACGKQNAIDVRKGVRDPELVRRVVMLGRGGAGKTTAAQEFGELLDIPVIELDKLFWSAELRPTLPGQWAARQVELARAECWVMDGDLGPYDVLAPRLARADTVVILDFGLLRCVWRAARRSRERRDFWLGALRWRRRSKPALLTAVAVNAPHSAVFVLRTPRQLRRLSQRLAS